MDRKETNKIIVAHPGRQHSFRLATALKKNNMLDSCISNGVSDEEYTDLNAIPINVSSSFKNVSTSNGIGHPIWISSFLVFFSPSSAISFSS